MKKIIEVLAIVYIPIFLLGALLTGISILLMTIGQFLMLEINKAKSGYEFMKRSVLRRR